MRTIIIPGNLLLMGEYAILEEGGMGLTLAIEPKLTITFEESDKLEIRGRYGNQTACYIEKEASVGDVKLFTDILDQCRKWLVWKKSSLPLATAAIDIDTISFFDGDVKRGYGSSAAVTVGLIEVLLSHLSVSVAEIFRLAVIAHRHFQGDVGSGYDIAASLFGGIGLFQGGEYPVHTPVELKHLPPLYLIRNLKPIITKQSIKQYNKWKAVNPSRAVDFVIQSNKHVLDFMKAESTADALDILDVAKHHSCWLGQQIGIPALWEDVDELLNEHCLFYKSLGAGNELGLCILKGNTLPKELDCLHPEPVILSAYGTICSWKE